MLDFETSDNKEDLLEHAKSMGIDANGRFNVDSIKQLIRDAGKTAPVIAVAKKVKLLIHKTEGDTGSIDVPVSVNGKTWLIKRGIEVEVPAFIVEVLEHAVKDIYVQDEVTKSIVKREVPSYPYSSTAI
jgi:hypothetical protein